ncbi:MAG: hypothetical protein AB7V01_21750 [Vicinamibacterales bacterium]
MAHSALLPRAVAAARAVQAVPAPPAPQLLREPYSATHAVEWIEPTDGPPPPVTATRVRLQGHAPLPGVTLALDARTTDGSVVPASRIVIRVGIRRGRDGVETWTMRVPDEGGRFGDPSLAAPPRDVTDTWTPVVLALGPGEATPPVAYASRRWRFVAALERVEDERGEAIWSNLRVEDLLKHARFTMRSQQDR